MDNALAARRLHILALQHGVDLECGRVYARVKLVELLIDILVSSRGIDRRAATGTVRSACNAAATSRITTDVFDQFRI